MTRFVCDQRFNSQKQHCVGFLVACVVGLMVVLAGIHTTAYAQPNSGPDLGINIGENITYSYDQDTKTVTIGLTDSHGPGVMKDWDPAGSDPFSPFRDNDVVQKIIISDGITHVGNYAFSGMTAVTNIELPEGLTSIGIHAFESCYKLQSASFPSTLELIGDSAFSDCKKLANIVLPARVKTIEPYAFSGCENITSLTFPEGLQNLGTFSFFRCTALESIAISSSVQTVDSSAFAMCSNLKEAIIAEGVQTISQQAFYDCTALQHILLPSSLKAIQRDAFADTDLTDVTILSPDVSIHTNAFSGTITYTAPEGSTTQEYATAQSMSSQVLKAVQVADYQAPTCTLPGLKPYYRVTVGNATEYFEDELCATLIPQLDIWKSEGGRGYIAPYGHTWGAPEWKFSHDGAAATATFTCSVDQAVHTAHATVIPSVVTKPTCTTMGWTAYQATVEFDNQTYRSSISLNDIPVAPHDTVRIPGKPATAGSSGLKDYYQCVVCDQYFADVQGTVLIGDTKALETWKTTDAVIDALPVHVTQGADATITLTPGTTLQLKADGNFETFVGVKVDGQTVDPQYYKAWAGSTYVEFSAPYLEHLASGTHQVSIEFTDGAAQTAFTIHRPSDAGETDTATPSDTAPTTADGSPILKSSLPKTNDETAALLMMMLGLASIAGWTSVAAYTRRRND